MVVLREDAGVAEEEPARQETQRVERDVLPAPHAEQFIAVLFLFVWVLCGEGEDFDERWDKVEPGCVEGYTVLPCVCVRERKEDVDTKGLWSGREGGGKGGGKIPKIEVSSGK